MNLSDVNKDGIGMDGLDPVAHYNGESLKGDPMYSFTVGDVSDHFNSAENQLQFEKDPAKYIPTAGGYPTGTRVKPPAGQEANGKYVGGKTFDYRRNMEDNMESLENNVAIDIKEDGSMEMQNLHDSEK